jgi:hypothetical protein
MSASVVIYNADVQEILGHTSVEEAITMVIAKKAIIVEETEKIFRSPSGFSVVVPKAIALVKYVFARWKYRTTGVVPFSKIGVFRRDNWTCAYCSAKLDKGTATADHIMPKWKGNAASWLNSITACRPCNSKKGGRSPQEAGMKLKFLPYEPSFADAWKFTHSD